MAATDLLLLFKNNYTAGKAIIAPVYTKGKKLTTEESTNCHIINYNIMSKIHLSTLTPHLEKKIAKYVIDQLLITCSAILRC
jgi:hypothetical protein